MHELVRCKFHEFFPMALMNKESLEVARGERVATAKLTALLGSHVGNCVSSSNQGTSYSRFSLALSHPRVSLSLLCRCNLTSFVTSLLSATKEGRTERGFRERNLIEGHLHVTPPFVHVVRDFLSATFPLASSIRFLIVDRTIQRQRCAFTD